MRSRWVRVPVLQGTPAGELENVEGGFHFSPATHLMVFRQPSTGLRDRVKKGAPIAREILEAKIRTQILYGAETFYSILEPEEVRDLFGVWK